MSILEETKFIMKKYGIFANKSLGQNFLIHETVVEKIVEAAQITKEDLVIEIGPGLGTLTKYLVESAGKVVCIELDDRMIRILEDRFSLYQNLEILHEDILKVNLHEQIAKKKEEGIKRAKIVANLPYYITTPIIMKLLEDRIDIESITVMVQKEVAERLIANPGEEKSGAITYSVNYYADARKVIDVPNSSFIPEPEVNSSVIQLKVRKSPRVEVANETLFFKIIKAAFMQKRKTLVNALVNGKIFTNKEEAFKMINYLQLDEKVRGEKLTLEQYKQILDYIESQKK